MWKKKRRTSRFSWGNNKGEESEGHSKERKGRNISTYNFIHRKIVFKNKSKVRTFADILRSKKSLLADTLQELLQEIFQAEEK